MIDSEMFVATSMKHNYSSLRKVMSMDRNSLKEASGKVLLIYRHLKKNMKNWTKSIWICVGTTT